MPEHRRTDIFCFFEEMKMTVPSWFLADIQTVLDVLHSGDAAKAAILLQVLYDALTIGD